MVAAEEARTLAEQTSIDQIESIWVEESMTVAVYPAATAVGASVAIGFY
jgi:hypothetical protein